MVKEIVGFEWEISLNKSKPNGTPRNLVFVSKLKKFGWEGSINLNEGIKSVCLDIKESKWLN